MKFFISYGHDCADFISKVAQALKCSGHEVWMDYEKLYSGIEWREAIAKAIVESQAVLLFHSKHSLRKGGVCHDEINIAVACNRRIIRSILMDNDLMDKVPPILNDKQYYVFSDWKEWLNDESIFHKKIQEIVDDITAMTDDVFDEQMEALKIALHPNLLKNRLLYLLDKPYNPRLWIRNRITDWLETTSRMPLLFVGFPGSGKSSFCANFSQWSPFVVSCIFCEWRENNRYDFKQIIRTIAYQIAEKLSSFRARLLWVLHSNVISNETMATEDLFEALILEPFRYVIDGQHPPVLIILDGVDEVSVENENELAKMLSNFRNRFPSFVHVFISMRKDANVMRHYLGDDSIELCSTDDLVRQDVLSFLIDNLTGVDIEEVDKVSNFCEGSYLLASLMVSCIKSGGICIADSDSLPKDIYSIYFQWMSRLVSPEVFLEKYATAFSILVAIKEPIGIEVFRTALGWNMGAVALFINKFKTFLTEEISVFGKKRIQLFHRSFGDWIANENFIADLYYVDPSEGRTRLSDAAYLLYCQGKLDAEELLKLWDYVYQEGNENYRLLLQKDDDYFNALLKIAREYINSAEFYHLATEALLQCATLCSLRHDEFAQRCNTVYIPIIKAKGLFCSGDYIGVECVLKNNMKSIEQDASLEDWMECLYMMGTACDLLGARVDSLSYFNQLLLVANKNNSEFYKTRALAGLLWNSHFNDIEKMNSLLKDLQSNAGETNAERTTLRLLSARALLSQGDLHNALSKFISIINSPSSFIWGFDHLAIRNQMLLIESLVACYDSEEFELGIKYGMQIYERLKGSNSIAECYVASWIATNLMANGDLGQADLYLGRAEMINEMANGARTSRWINMHLTSIRAFWYEENGEYEKAIKGHAEVMHQAVICDDLWVLGDACFELLLLAHYFPIDHKLYDEAHANLARSVMQSKLPHLSFKHKLLTTYEMKSTTKEVWDELLDVLLNGELPSTDMVMCEGMGFEIAKRTGRIADCDALRNRIKKEIAIILQKNKDTKYVNRRKIKQLLEEISK